MFYRDSETLLTEAPECGRMFSDNNEMTVRIELQERILKKNRSTVKKYIRKKSMCLTFHSK